MKYKDDYHEENLKERPLRWYDYVCWGAVAIFFTIGFLLSL